jgi:hypothetical protein
MHDWKHVPILLMFEKVEVAINFNTLDIIVNLFEVGVRRV